MSLIWRSLSGNFCFFCLFYYSFAKFYIRFLSTWLLGYTLIFLAERVKMKMPMRCLPIIKCVRGRWIEGGGVGRGVGELLWETYNIMWEIVQNQEWAEEVKIADHHKEVQVRGFRLNSPKKVLLTNQIDSSKEFGVRFRESLKAKQGRQRARSQWPGRGVFKCMLIVSRLDIICTSCIYLLNCCCWY